MTLRLKWQEMWPSLVAMGMAFLAAMAIAVYVMQAPTSDLQALARFLLTSSLPSLIVGYLIFIVVRKWLRSIRQKVLLAYALGIIIAIFNIYVTSQLMFVSQHDFLLLGLLLIFSGLIAGAFGYILATDITRSLYSLQDGANQLATGDFSTKVHVDEVDELSDVANAFNMMTDELERSFARQRQLEKARRDLTVAVSHDLRTPLASIRAMVEAIADGVVTDPATVQRYYATINTQITSLSSLINDLFELSKLEAEPVQLRKEAVNLNDLLSDVLESMQAKAKEISLQGDFKADIPLVQAELQKIQRVLYNLVQNAIQHTPAGGSITLAIHNKDQGVQIDIIDTGEGIAAEDIPHIFDQFFRGEKSRSRATGGTGLGLAIAKGIIEAHNGQIWVESQAGRGTTFSFILPLK